MLFGCMKYDNKVIGVFMFRLRLKLSTDALNLSLYLNLFSSLDLFFGNEFKLSDY